MRCTQKHLCKFVHKKVQEKDRLFGSPASKPHLHSAKFMSRFNCIYGRKLSWLFKGRIRNFILLSNVLERALVSISPRKKRRHGQLMAHTVYMRTQNAGGPSNLNVVCLHGFCLLFIDTFHFYAYSIIVYGPSGVVARQNRWNWVFTETDVHSNKANNEDKQSFFLLFLLAVNNKIVLTARGQWVWRK